LFIYLNILDLKRIQKYKVQAKSIKELLRLLKN